MHGDLPKRQPIQTGHLSVFVQLEMKKTNTQNAHKFTGIPVGCKWMQFFNSDQFFKFKVCLRIWLSASDPSLGNAFDSKAEVPATSSCCDAANSILLAGLAYLSPMSQICGFKFGIQTYSQ
jgi:hypothetical protein